VLTLSEVEGSTVSLAQFLLIWGTSRELLTIVGNSGDKCVILTLAGSINHVSTA